MPTAGNFYALSDANRAELWASLALGELKTLGVAKQAKLVEHFGSPYKAVQNTSIWPELGIKEEAVQHYKSERWRGAARKKWDAIRESGENILLYADQSYPALLREISDPPLFLFYRGDISLLKNASVAVVGSRKCTHDGMSVAVNIVRGLSKAGVTTISGLAKGIDRVVHLAGLESSGSSIAVLGCGIDVIYPPANLDLYDLMQEKGLIISEFLPGTSPMPYRFPIRNRIISGLSRAVLVVEAAERSGTLITARHAAEQGRDVFAVPGSTLSDTSEGCRDLIRRGAKPVFTAEDILLELSPILRAGLPSQTKYHSGSKAADALDKFGILPWDNSSAPSRECKPVVAECETKLSLDTASLDKICSNLGETEQCILKILNEQGNCHIDAICAISKIQVGEISQALLVLEVQGVVKKLPGMYYSINH